MNLRERGLSIDSELKEEYMKWKSEIRSLEKSLAEQSEILRSEEAQHDRSENAMRENAINTKQDIERQIKLYETRIASHDEAYVQYSTETYKPEGIIKVGSVVHITVIGQNKEFVVKIVPRHSDAPLKGAISISSPLGTELIGKKQGESVSCRTDRGVWTFTIEEVY